MRPFHFIVIVLMTISLTCTKKFTIELEPLEKRLVVHGFVGAGEHFNVRVGRTIRTGNFDDFYLANAQVVLYGDGAVLDTLHYDAIDKTYKGSRVLAQPGTTYTLKVSVDGYPPVEATDKAPVLPPTESLEHIRKSRRTQWGADLDDIVISFRDPATVKNYYLVDVRDAWGYSIFCVYSTDQAIERASTDLLPFDRGDCIDGSSIFYSDVSFDGGLKSLRLSVTTREMDSTLDVDNFRWRKPFIRRMAVSQTYYEYYKYVKTLKDRDDLPFFTETTDPAGNVRDGYGIFTVYDLQVDSIR